MNPRVLKLASFVVTCAMILWMIGFFLNAYGQLFGHTYRIDDRDFDLIWALAAAGTACLAIGARADERKKLSEKKDKGE